ncbi:hypothetical protein [Cohnella caldifontis]|uniref:hypothetical protein n=1 Tax=Cohnella caldifontis TaxID=3027471 RepID=UPI0023EAE8AA|nr:hypothetical protein [Cohnella sp. YIM B05605]
MPFPKKNVPFWLNLRITSEGTREGYELTTAKWMKLLSLIIGAAIFNIIILSPGFVGITIGENALSTAIGVTLLLASALAVIYGCNMILMRKPVHIQAKLPQSYDEYPEALRRFRRIVGVEDDIALILEQIERIRKKKETLFNVLNQRFAPEEMSHKKFASVTEEVEKLFYLNIRSLLNRLSVVDERDFERAMARRKTRLSPDVLQERATLYNDFLAFLKNCVDTNEEILLKLDKLLVEISNLDSLSPGDIENMPGMQEIDLLIKQTKLYKQ